MKKASLIILGVTLIAVSVIGYNFYSGGAVVQEIEYLVSKKPTAAETQTQVTIPKSDTETLGMQAYSCLTEEEQKAFDTICNGISAHKQSVFINPAINSQRVFELVQLVLAQHPEFFWTNGSCSLSSTGLLSFSYIYTDEETSEKKLLIEEKTKEIYNKINPTGSDYDKSLAIFEYVVKNTSYNYDAVGNLSKYPQVSTIEGVFLNNSAVCSGYSKAYQYLLKLAGIDAITVSGSAQTPTGKGEHAWTAQVIDGENYFTDVTWGDSFEKSYKNDFVNHTYFLMNSEDIKDTHFCDEIYSFINGNSTANNYFVKENLYYEEYNQALIRNEIKNKLNADSAGVELRFANEEAYREAQTNLFDRENIYVILKAVDPFSEKIDTSNISASSDDTHKIIIVFFVKK